MTLRFCVAWLLVCTSLPMARETGGKAEYVGGTIAEIPKGCSGHIVALDERDFVFAQHKAEWRVPYERVNLLEYGQNVNRHVLASVLISPLIMLAKNRVHFLTVGYADESGKQQAMIFRVNKSDIRATLATLEARTGRKVEYQDDEARKAGKG